MRILSQDGKIAILLSGHGYLNIRDRGVYLTSFGGNYTDLKLGKYGSEKRAKEVLFEIAQHKESLYVMPEV